MKSRLSRVLVPALSLMSILAACAGQSQSFPPDSHGRAAQARGIQIPPPAPSPPPGTGDCATMTNPANAGLATVQVNANGFPSQPTVSYTVQVISCASTDGNYFMTYTQTPTEPACAFATQTLTGPTFPLNSGGSKGVNFQLPVAGCATSSIWNITVQLYPAYADSAQFVNNSDGTRTQIPMRTMTGASYTEVVAPRAPLAIASTAPATPPPCHVITGCLTPG
jgi:hypothetical protein